MVRPSARAGFRLIPSSNLLACSTGKSPGLPRTIPIVFPTAIHPVGTGVITSLRRPGGNVTGGAILFAELSAKRLDLLKEVLPGLYPIEHRALALRFGSDSGVTILGFRSLACWCLGYPEAALTDADRAIEDAREIGQAATLMLALCTTTWTQIF